MRHELVKPFRDFKIFKREGNSGPLRDVRHPHEAGKTELVELGRSCRAGEVHDESRHAVNARLRDEADELRAVMLAFIARRPQGIDPGKVQMGVLDFKTDPMSRFHLLGYGRLIRGLCGPPQKHGFKARAFYEAEPVLKL